jgi:hypothetical protein
MPATQRGSAYRLGPNRWGLRFYDADGNRRRKSPFPSKSAALAHYRDVIEPQLRGEAAAREDLTLAEFIPVFLERHGASGVRPRTVSTLRDRLSRATDAFGGVRLRDLERMTNELAAWQARLPERSRYGITSALRQALEAAVRWEYADRNPAKAAGRNRQPAPRAIRVFSADEVEAIAAELSAMYRPLRSGSSLRRSEWRLRRTRVPTSRSLRTHRVPRISALLRLLPPCESGSVASQLNKAGL